MVPDELAPEVLKEAETHLLQLNAQILAAQLTLQVQISCIIKIFVGSLSSFYKLIVANFHCIAGFRCIFVH